jgi:putative ABC transport system permease protein
MKTPLAWYNLLLDKVRTAVAIAGVAFAVVLILMQLGFYGAVLQTATLIYDRLRFDLLLCSPSYLHLSKSGTISRNRLSQAESLPEIAAAEPLYIGFNLWRNVDTGRRRGIMVLGIDPQQPVLELPGLPQVTPLLTQPDAALLDRRSRPEFGPQEVGLETDVGNRRVRVVGQFTMGTGFGADGAILVSERTFGQLFPARPLEQVSLGLVTLKPGADPDQAAERLRELLPPDVSVMTRAEISAHERRHWTTKTSVGLIFGMGVVVAIIVGIAIVYQVLSSDITNRLGEYATLKAIGYTNAYLARVVLQQAVLLAIFGFIPGLGLSLLLYQLTQMAAHVPMDMAASRAIVVGGLSVVMCSLAAVAALRKVYSADPADLF